MTVAKCARWRRRIGPPTKEEWKNGKQNPISDRVKPKGDANHLTPTSPGRTNKNPAHPRLLNADQVWAKPSLWLVSAGAAGSLAIGCSSSSQTNWSSSTARIDTPLQGGRPPVRLLFSRATGSQLSQFFLERLPVSRVQLSLPFFLDIKFVSDAVQIAEIDGCQPRTDLGDAS